MNGEWEPVRGARLAAPAAPQFPDRPYRYRGRPGWNPRLLGPMTKAELGPYAGRPGPRARRAGEGPAQP